LQTVIAIAWLVCGLLVGIVALGRLAASGSREWSDEEWERRRATRSSGLLATSMRALGEELGAGGKRVADETRALEQGERETPERATEPPTPSRH
jgi:hypothetical protein